MKKKWIEGMRVTHPEYGETKIDCIPLLTDFGSTEQGEFCYLARHTLPDQKVYLPLTPLEKKKGVLPHVVLRTIAGGLHDPWVHISELTFSAVSIEAA
jgi:hypothetical protein